MNHGIASVSGKKGIHEEAGERSIKLSNQLNVRGANNKGSNMGGFWFGQLN